MEELVSSRPEERLYVQLDKPFYEPGDDIWLSGYLRDGVTLSPSQVSDIVHVELINPRGGVEKKISLVATNGKVSGDFLLDKDAVGGLYKIKAYTNWMKNDGEENCFIKEIQVQEVILPKLKMKLDFEKKAFGAGDLVIAKVALNTNENKALSSYSFQVLATINGQKISEITAITDAEGLGYFQFRLPSRLSTSDGLVNVLISYNGSTESISRSIPIVLNKIRVTMFPEGGDLLQGFTSTVAFRALNEFGKPADIEGVVESSKGTRIATFSSFHQGMGSFNIIPQQGENYFLRITKPAGITEIFPLPEPLEKGYAMSVTTGKEEASVNISSTETTELALVAQVRGKIFYSAVIAAMPGENLIRFSTRDFPAGVAQLTIFDEKGIARAERLAFVNKHRQLKVSVLPDKEKYLPREKIKLFISVKDERSLPMPANLSMAVVNDQLLSFADDRTGNIVSELLLQQDLKEKVEEPSFYFDPKEKKADAALDHLLLTSGWRRFTWEKIIENKFPPVGFAAQKAIISGVVLDANTGKPLANTRIKRSDGQVMNTDVNGSLVIKDYNLGNPLTIECQLAGYLPASEAIAEYTQGMHIYMYSNHYMRKRSAQHNNRVMMEMEGMVPQAAPMAREEAPEADMQMLKRSAPRVAQQQPKVAGGIKSAEKKEKAEEKMSVADNMFGMAGKADRDDVFIEEVPANHNNYYRAREFYAPSYSLQQQPEQRTDFRNTIYWNPAIEIGHSGKKTVEFFASDDITSFRAVTEGMSRDGSVGRNELTIFTQLPFQMVTKIPAELITGDILSIPVTLKNNTAGPLGGLLSVDVPPGLKMIGDAEMVQTIMPGKAKTVLLGFKVADLPGEAPLTVSFKSCALTDAFTQNIRIVSKGFPVQLSFSGNELQKEYSFETSHLVQGSLKASFTAFPNVVSDLMKGVEGILQEPYGCFEQTSCTAYPNAMVLDYLKHTGNNDTKVLAHATQLLDRGYKRLTTFETPGKGYEWFGASPAHEGLTAYGIMEFVDMKNAGQAVDQQMLDRTARWLLSHKDGKGGFEREQRALHDFGRISDDVMNAYIVYALAEAGYNEIKKEFEHVYQKAMSGKDGYLLALVANAAYSLDEKQKGDAALKVLLETQLATGEFKGLTHSITYSQGNSLSIETTALTIMAMLKSGAPDGSALSRSVQYLLSARSGSGVFSSTQGTILALKALTAYAKYNKHVAQDGTIYIYVDGSMVAEKNYKAGDKGGIIIDGLEKYIRSEGRHVVRVKYSGTKEALPYSVSLNYNTSLPASDNECAVMLTSSLAASSAKVGETVRLSTTIKNTRTEDIPSTMVIIGIPAGLSVQPWQLKELQEKKIFDYYEIRGNNLALYYRGMSASSQKTISLDLKAEIPGTFDAPASCAYLYYTNEYKRWVSTGKVTIQ